MNTCVQLWANVIEFFLDREMLHIKSHTENQNTFYVQQVSIENRAIYEMKPIQHGAYALHSGYGRLKAHTRNM